MMYITDEIEIYELFLHDECLFWIKSVQSNVLTQQIWWKLSGCKFRFFFWKKKLLRIELIDTPMFNYNAIQYMDKITIFQVMSGS